MPLQIKRIPEDQPNIDTAASDLPFAQYRFADKTMASYDGLIASLILIEPDTFVLGSEEKVPVGFVVGDLTNAETREPTQSVEILDGGNGEDMTVRDTNRGRMELLARKYAEKTLTPEQSARLSILTERVRAIMPRVSDDDFQSLDKLESILEKSKAIREKMISDLDLKT